MGSLGVLGGADEVATVTMHPSGKRTIGPLDHEIDWEKYGLGHEIDTSKSTLEASGKGEDGDGGDDKRYFHEKGPKDNELFTEDQRSTKPWWKANFFLSGPTLFGTWDGVFTTCMINIFGVIVFLRSGWMVAQAGIGLSVAIVVTAVCVVLVTVFAAIGICSRCQMERGGVYFVISHVLGTRIAGSVGLLYCFGQAVGASINIVGFGKSMGQVFHLENIWIERSIGASVLLFLTAINLIGVTRVIKVQFVLLLILLLAALDFTVGSFVHTNPAKGVDGYYSNHFWDNAKPAFEGGETWFTVFGVFFPTVTGILAGLNMSGDLRNPSRDFPVGTLSAIGVSSFLYFVFILVLGATCQRWALSFDTMITEKVSAVGFLLLAGLYVSSLSSCLGSLYGTPRVLQTIAGENAIPFLKFLGWGRGPNQVPIIGTVAVSLVSLAFVFVGDINTLGPIVTLPFLLTYATTDYAYFSLAMTFDIQRKRDERLRAHSLLSPTFEKCSKSTSNYGSVKGSDKGSEKMESGGDLDSLFPERTKYKSPLKQQHSSATSTVVSSPDEHSSIVSEESVHSSWAASNLKSGLNGVDDGLQEGLTDLRQLLPKGRSTCVLEKDHTWYHSLSNRWLSLFGVLANLVIMFLVQWIFAIVNIALMLLIYFYISCTNPGVPPGISEFKLLPWIKFGFKRLIGRSSPEYDHIVVTPMHPGVEVREAQLTDDNEDYAARERYHQSSLVHGSKFTGLEGD